MPPRAEPTAFFEMPRHGAVTLSDLIAPTLTLVCEPCGRKAVYNVARLKNKYAATARLTDQRSFLTIDCPNRGKRDPRPMPGGV
jgi:hypothetical protein